MFDLQKQWTNLKEKHYMVVKIIHQNNQRSVKLCFLLTHILLQLELHLFLGTSFWDDIFVPIIFAKIAKPQSD